MPSHLLLIDDDTRLTTLVGDYLSGHGFEVDSAGSLKAGRDLLRHGSYDALLLDLMLPDGDGLDLTRELRAEPRTRRLPLLMLTARGEPMDRIVGLEIGADDYLPKPFEPRELLARLKALLRRAALARASTRAVVLAGQPKAIAETLQGLPASDARAGVPGIFAAVPYCIDLIGGPYLQTDDAVCKAFRPKSAQRPQPTA
jgi:DNA-binding response OmpR family regulator